MALALRRRHKYGAVRTEVGDISFASKKEASRYQELKLLERGGYIIGLELQPAFELKAPNGSRIGAYIADFAYHEKVEGGTRWVVEDVKGCKTALYRWKKRHCEAQYGIQIREV